jgi:hypothetical protein
MVGFYPHDKARFKLISALTCETFGKGHAPTTRRSRLKFTALCKASFGKSPSEILNGVHAHVENMLELAIALAPTPAGTLPSIACPNGWPKERFESLLSLVEQALTNSADRLLRRRSDLLRFAHSRGETAIKPRASAILNAKTREFLLATLSWDAAHLAHTTGLPLTTKVANHLLVNALCTLRLQDDEFKTSVHKIKRQAEEALQSYVHENSRTRFHRLMRRCTVIEDKLNRMGYQVTMHSSDPRALFGISQTQEEMPSDGPIGGPGPGLRVATFNASTLKGSDNGRPQRAYEIIEHARAFGINLIAVQETRVVNGEEVELPAPWKLLNKGRVMAPTRNNNRNPGGGVGWLINTACGYPVSIIDCNPARTHLERLWIKVKTATKPLYLCSIYWPPDSSKVNVLKEDIESLRTDLVHYSTLGDVGVLGDFNSHIAMHSSNRLKCKRAKLLCPLLEEFGLTPRNRHEITHKRKADPTGSIIDYVCLQTSIHSKGTRLARVFAEEGHRLVAVCADKVLPHRVKNMKRKRFDLAKLKEIEGISAQYKERISQFVEANPNAGASQLSTAIIGSATEVLGYLSPSKPSMDKAMPEWWTNEITLLVSEKRTILRKQVLSPSDSAQINHLTAKIKKLTRIRSRSHWKMLLLHLGTEARSQGGLSRSSWRTLHTILQGRSAPPNEGPSPEANEKLWSNIWANKDDTEERAAYETWKAKATVFPPPLDDIDKALLAPFSVDELHRVLNTLPDHKAADNDGMVNELLKILPDLALEAFSKSFTEFLTCSFAYPENWTIANVILLFKSANAFQISGSHPPRTVASLAKSEAFSRVTTVWIPTWAQLW